MSNETPSSAANTSNLVDLLSTLNPTVTAMASSTILTPSSTTTNRTEDMNVDSSDFVPANRLLLQRQALHNHKQRMSIYSI